VTPAFGGCRTWGYPTTTRVLSVSLEEQLELDLASCTLQMGTMYASGDQGQSGKYLNWGSMVNKQLVRHSFNLAMPPLHTGALALAKLENHQEARLYLLASAVCRLKQHSEYHCILWHSDMNSA
jgi:hypothetical protein